MKVERDDDGPDWSWERMREWTLNNHVRMPQQMQHVFSIPSEEAEGQGNITKHMRCFVGGFPSVKSQMGKRSGKKGDQKEFNQIKPQLKKRGTGAIKRNRLKEIGRRPNHSRGKRGLPDQGSAVADICSFAAVAVKLTEIKGT